MFDYNRGYAPDIEASGVMDVFRLPKFGYWFFRSQRDATELVAGQPVGPMAFIANYWTPDSPREVRVFSNCEEVALSLNGKLLERRRPDTSRVSTHVKHAPFTFALDRFETGTLKAIGYIGGHEVITHERRTPGAATTLKLRFDWSGRPFGAHVKDAVFCHADLVDASDTVIPTAKILVFFGTDGPVRLIGQNPIPTEAGTATVLLESDTANSAATVYALSLLPDGEQTRILATAASPNGTKVSNYTIRYTTDGSAPSATSSEYRKPIRSHPQLRVAIVVNGKVVAGANARAVAASLPAPGSIRAAANSASD
jgi:beta-galactosidase